MKAIVIHAAHDLRIEDRPVESPGPGQVRLRLATGGVCGSDLHYFHNGGFGAVRLKEPMILGHEVSAHVAELGAGVSGLDVGQLVAISPSRPCGTCRFCQEGLRNQCLNMRFYGSAMPFPHIQGAFREEIVAEAWQCVAADGLSAGEAAMAEPLAVVLHSARRAGDLMGKRVLVTGCGPIGVLAVLVARRAGAAEIVATDLSDYNADKGTFDVLFECSGAAPALAAGIAAMRPRGIIMQLGMGGDMSLPMLAITAKELDLRGSFRFHEEFATGVHFMQQGLIDVKPLITHTMPLDRALDAFKVASDRTQAMKAQIAFA